MSPRPALLPFPWLVEPWLCTRAQPTLRAYSPCVASSCCFSMGATGRPSARSQHRTLHAHGGRRPKDETLLHRMHKPRHKNGILIPRRHRLRDPSCVEMLSTGRVVQPANNARKAQISALFAVRNDSRTRRFGVVRTCPGSRDTPRCAQSPQQRPGCARSRRLPGQVYCAPRHHAARCHAMSMLRVQMPCHPADSGQSWHPVPGTSRDTRSCRLRAPDSLAPFTRKKRPSS